MIYHDHLTFMMFIQKTSKNKRNRNQRNKPQGFFILKTKFIINQQGSQLTLKRFTSNLDSKLQPASKVPCVATMLGRSFVVSTTIHVCSAATITSWSSEAVRVILTCEEKEGRKKDLRMGYGDGAKLFVPDIYIYTYCNI